MTNILSLVQDGKRHYVYGLYYPEQMGGSLFYIGKGQGRRIYKHEEEAKGDKQENPYKCNVIKKIWEKGWQVEKRMLAYFETNDEALLYERSLVFFMDGLTNLTGGGDGVYAPDAIVREKMSQARKRVVLTEATREKHRQRMYGNTYNKGRVFSEEVRQKMSLAHKGQKRSDEARKNIVNAIRGRVYSEEARRNMSAGQRRRYTKEEVQNDISN